LDKLGLDYFNIDEFSCCGSQIAESFNEEILISLSARNLALAQKHNIDYIITLCGSCTYILKNTKKSLQNNKIRDSVNQILKSNNLEYDVKKDVRIMHITELLNLSYILHKLKEKISVRLKLKVAVQKPCMIFRPSRINMDQNPELIATLLDLCGIKLVEYEYMDRCCGGTMLAFDESIGRELAKQRYDVLKKINPDLIVTSCPNCHLIYNIYPNVIDVKIPPTVFLTQLIAFCLGFSFEEVALSRNIEKVRVSKIIRASMKTIG